MMRRNKTYNYLMEDIDIFISNCMDNPTRIFMKAIRNLLRDYKNENSKYKERIKTLKEVIRLIGHKANG